MPTPNYDDPVLEEHWCREQQACVVDYLRAQELHHGSIGEWPAWHIAPCVAIWAIESLARPGAIGWWAITGDLPTDYISAASVQPPQHPRNAMRVIAERWLKQAEAWKSGREYEGVRIPGPHSHQELAPLLTTRAQLLIDWCQDDSFWEEA